jgi:hypothetical protein
VISVTTISIRLIPPVPIASISITSAAVAVAVTVAAAATVVGGAGVDMILKTIDSSLIKF